MLSYEQADAVPDDAAKGFGISASLDAAAAEGAKPCATAGSNKPIAAPQLSLLLIRYSKIRCSAHGLGRLGMGDGLSRL